MPNPPYPEIADLIKRGEVIPFLGAGVNYGARQPPDAEWEAQSTFLPTGMELSRFLAMKSNFPVGEDDDANDLAKVASYFEETIARRRLRERLREIFDRDYDPCDAHTYLAEVAGSTPLLIVTTNYDDLTECAFRKLGRPFDLVVHPTDRKEIQASVLWWKHGSSKPQVVPPNQLVLDLKETTVIYKMHGAVDRTLREWDSYVISEDDYVNFLSQMVGQTAVPAQFMRHFRTRHFLFLGYGLRDWNLRVVLKNLRKPLLTGKKTGDDEEGEAAKGAASGEEEEEELRSWAIQYRPSALEQELWNARRVKIYDVDINEFIRELRRHT